MVDVGPGFGRGGKGNDSEEGGSDDGGVEPRSAGDSKDKLANEVSGEMEGGI